MKTVLKVLLPLLLVGAAYLGAKKLIASKPEPPKREIKDVIPKVKVIRLKAQSHQPQVRSFGTVQSYDEARLTPELSARIIWVSDSFRVGNEVEQGESLVKLERSDFETELETRKANLSEIERQLAEEQVRSQQAADDWVASGRQLDTASDFRLRKPQLQALEAQLASAKASVAQAELDLARTEIRAPFTSRVLSRDANLGEQSNPQTSLGTLASIERAEVRLPLTAEQVAGLSTNLTADFSQQQSLTVKLELPEQEGVRIAQVKRMDPSIDARNQVRYLIAEVESPFAAEPFPLPIGTFVNAAFEGRELRDSLRFPESAMVEDRYVWIVETNDGEQTLDRLPLERLATEEGDIIARPLKPLSGEIAIVSRPLTTFRPGMKVEISNPAPSEQPQS